MLARERAWSVACVRFVGVRACAPCSDSMVQWWRRVGAVSLLRCGHARVVVVLSRYHLRTHHCRVALMAARIAVSEYRTIAAVACAVVGADVHEETMVHV